MNKIKGRIKPRRIPMPEQNPVARAGNFGEVALGYTPDMAREEASRCLQCKDPTCIKGCPVNVPIPQFIDAIRDGDFKRAIDIIKEKNVLPAVCGRVCPQENQCEMHCLLGKKHEPVAIGRLERFAADEELRNERVPEPLPKNPKGKKVAVIGSGPSGLTCAFDLAMLGYKVTVFEAFHEPGGVLIYGIPEFRLPKKSVVSREIDALKDMGVEFVLNAVIGKILSIEEIMKDFDACFIAVGAGLPRFMGIEGENLNGVYSANEFLTRTNLMRAYLSEYDTPIKRGQRVAVVGGGNVAMDSIRTALRLGAEEAIVIYRRTEEEMPARAEEVHHAKEEGVRFEFLTSPVRIIGENGSVKAVECLRMQLGEQDASGRRKPVPINGSEFQIPLDVLIVAVGTEANPLVTKITQRLALTERGYIVTDESTGRTSMEGVYAGGDIVTGSATVISAMGAGRKAAGAIHAFLSGRESNNTNQVDFKQIDPNVKDLANPQDEYKIKLPVFEGPLDLLLHLIRENKIDIYDIPIALITGQYLEYMELMKEMNLEIAGEFLVMAATLIHIKSRMLLPVEETADVEELEDPRLELVQKLLQYQELKEAALALKDREDEWSDVFRRDPSLSGEDESGGDEGQMLFNLNLFDLMSAFKNILERAPSEIASITRETLTVRDKMTTIINLLETHDAIRFEELFDEGASKVHLIVTFVALLETIRLGLAKVYQESEFGTLWVLRGQSHSAAETPA